MQGGREGGGKGEGRGEARRFWRMQNTLSLTHTNKQELLSLFGLPYIVSPSEAEAQCAALDVGGLTQVGRCVCAVFLRCRYM